MKYNEKLRFLNKLYFNKMFSLNFIKFFYIKAHWSITLFRKKNFFWGMPNHDDYSEMFLGTHKTIVTKPLTISQNNSIIHIWESPKYASAPLFFYKNLLQFRYRKTKPYKRSFPKEKGTYLVQKKFKKFCQLCFPLTLHRPNLLFQFCCAKK